MRGLPHRVVLHARAHTAESNTLPSRHIAALVELIERTPSEDESWFFACDSKHCSAIAAAR